MNKYRTRKQKANKQTDRTDYRIVLKRDPAEARANEARSCHSPSLSHGQMTARWQGSFGWNGNSLGSPIYIGKGGGRYKMKALT